MIASDELLTIAEISIGIAGFSGVVVAFLQRDGLHSVDRIRFVAVFSIAFMTLILSFVPIVLGHLGLDGTSLWSRANVIMLVFWTLNMTPMTVVMPKARREIYVDSSTPILMLLGPALLNFVVQVFNAGGWFWEPGFVAYLFGLFVYLYSAGLLFVLTVIFRPRE